MIDSGVIAANELTIDGAIAAVAGGDRVLKSIFEQMEHRDHWVLDQPGNVIDRTLVELGELMQRQAFDISADLSSDDLIDLLAMLRTGRFYRLFREVSSRRREVAEKIIHVIDASEASGAALPPELNVLRSRLLIAKQAQFLSTLFSEDRIEIMTLAVEDAYSDEY